MRRTTRFKPSTKWSDLLLDSSPSPPSSATKPPPPAAPTSVQEALDELDNGATKFALVATYSSLLRRCIKSRSLIDGKLVHSHLVDRGLSSSVVLSELLVQMYGKCRDLEQARRIFDSMARRSVYAWNLMLGAYVEQGLGREALDLYHFMDVEPDQFTYATVLGACSSLGALVEGKAIHARMIADISLISDAVSQNSLITMYAKCRRIEDARSVFNAMKDKEVASWNSMIAAYAQCGHSREALDLYCRMEKEGVQQNAVTFSTTLAACGEIGGAEGLAAGKSIHAKVVASDLRANVYVDTALLSMYANCCSLENAKGVFDTMQQRNVVSWTAMIAAYAQNGHHRQAIELFVDMDVEGVAVNAYGFSCALGACANLGDLRTGLEIHESALVRGYELDVSVRNAMVHLYGKCGCLDEAKLVFDGILSKNDISWNAMIAAYVQQGRAKEALEVYHSLEEQGTEPNDFMFASVVGACSTLEELQPIHFKFSVSKFKGDEVVNNALIRAYSRCGSLDIARTVFDEMPSRDEVSWNAMITSYVQLARYDEALELYSEMLKSSSQPNGITFSSVLTACLNVGTVELGRTIHAAVGAAGFETEVVVGTALVNMYAKFGWLNTARTIFDAIPHRTVVCWSAIITAYAQNGETGGAIDAYRTMQLDGGEQPDETSFVCVLTAFSHAGLLEQGKDCFMAMEIDHGIRPGLDHYLCMVDLLGRSGRLDLARKLVHEMPFEPDIASWMTLLGGCKVQSDRELGEYAAAKVLELDPVDSAPYVLLAQVRAADEWVDSSLTSGLTSSEYSASWRFWTRGEKLD